MLRGRRAIGALLHRHQFVSDRRRTRLHRQQQPVQGADHFRGEARDRARGAAAIAPRSNFVSSSMGRATATRVRNLDEATAEFPATPIADESLGAAMLYSSGTTGRPKGCSGRCPTSLRSQPLTAARRAVKAVAISRGPDLSLACAALPRGALGRRLRHDPPRRDGHRHGAVRPGTFSGARREASRHPRASSCRRCSRAC